MAKIAGVSLTGFVAASFLADKVQLNPAASQLAGFAGAFLGTLIAGRRKRRFSKSKDTPAPDAGKTEAPSE
jgi:hypothetical protein